MADAAMDEDQLKLVWATAIFHQLYQEISDGLEPPPR